MRKSQVRESPSWSKVIRWPVFLVINLCLMFVVGISTVRETYRGWSVDREIRALEAHAAALEGRKLQLQVLAQDLVSPERVELDARSRLGRKKAGERVIILEGLSTPSSTERDEPVSISEIVSTPPEKRLSNPERWRQYFFH